MLNQTQMTTIHLAGRTYRVVSETPVAYERCRIVDGKEVWYVQRFTETIVRQIPGRATK